jgi:hypothetical protein
MMISKGFTAPMPLLKNARHEIFAQEIVKGVSGRDAYKIAGFAVSNDNAADASASRLLRDVKVQARLQELQQMAQARAMVTISAPDVAIREQVRGRYAAFLLEMYGRNAHWTGHECLECPQMWGTTFGFQIARSSGQVSVHSENYDSEHQCALSEAIPEEFS